jgi:hypothetical protein
MYAEDSERYWHVRRGFRAILACTQRIPGIWACTQRIPRDIGMYAEDSERDSLVGLASP